MQLPGQAARRPGHAARGRRRRTTARPRARKSWRDGKVVLYRFRGDRAPTAKVPLLISYALVNRPYMVDLQADKSIVRGLLERGEDVYIIDWGYPDRSDRYLELEDYIQRFLGGAVDHLRRTYRLDAINLLGICQGGAFSLCYAALNPEQGPQPDHHGHAGGFPHRRQHAVELDARPGRGPVRRHARQRAGRPDELVLPHAEAVAAVRAEVRRAWSTSSTTSRRWRISCAWRSGSSIRRTRRARRSASSSSSSTRRNGFVNGGIEIGGRAGRPGQRRHAGAEHLSPSRTTWCRRRLRRR